MPRNKRKVEETVVEEVVESSEQQLDAEISQTALDESQIIAGDLQQETTGAVTQQRKRTKWSLEEEVLRFSCQNSYLQAKLREGVTSYGRDWKRIAEDLFDNSRSAVDVKDKWRNMERHQPNQLAPQGEVDGTATELVNPEIQRRRYAVTRRARMPWTPEEEEYLREGVTKHGEGAWSKILKEYQFSDHRTSVDLKDKYRNLTSTQILRPKRKYLLVGTALSFMNRFPQEAAMKAATRGFTHIVLKSEKEPRIYIYKGSSEMSKPPSIEKFSHLNPTFDMMRVGTVVKIAEYPDLANVPEDERRCHKRESLETEILDAAMDDGELLDVHITGVPDGSQEE